MILLIALYCGNLFVILTALVYLSISYIQEFKISGKECQMDFSSYINVLSEALRIVLFRAASSLHSNLAQMIWCKYYVGANRLDFDDLSCSSCLLDS